MVVFHGGGDGNGFFKDDSDDGLIFGFSNGGGLINGVMAWYGGGELNVWFMGGCC